MTEGAGPEGRLEVNGVPRLLASPQTVETLLREDGHDPQRPGIAVAVNGAVVPRRQWPHHLLADGDRVDVVEAVQGG